MYDSQRVNWWKRRSFSPEYQEAYDRIAQHTGFKWRTVLDIACGTGEVLKRIYSQQRNRIYVGTDATPEMIELAKNNLTHSGIPVKVVSSLEDLIFNRNEVVLFLDDFAKSNIPYNFADLTVHTFSEISGEYKEGPIDERMRRKLSQYSLTDEERSKLVMRLILERETAKRTKIGGNVVIAKYDTIHDDSDKESRIVESQRIQFGLVGLQLQLAKALTSSGVWGDTDGSGDLRNGEIPGYRVFRLTRTR